jgi:hypothetical protein
VAVVEVPDVVGLDLDAQHLHALGVVEHVEANSLHQDRRQVEPASYLESSMPLGKELPDVIFCRFAIFHICRDGRLLDAQALGHFSMSPAQPA